MITHACANAIISSQALLACTGRHIYNEMIFLEMTLGSSFTVRRMGECECECELYAMNGKWLMELAT